MFPTSTPGSESLSSVLKIAYRNLVRHRGRSLVAFLAAGLGAASLLWAGGFMEWIFWAMRESVIQSQYGHIQITRQGYQELGRAQPFRYVMDEKAPYLSTLRSIPEVEALNPRRNLAGLISHGETTLSFIGEAVDPAADAQINKYVFLKEGQGLPEDGGRGIVVGQGLARIMGLVVGDQVALLAKTFDGGINAVEVPVVGLFFTASKAYDDSALRMPMSLADQLLRSEGVHQWQILLDETQSTPVVLAQVRSLLVDTDLQADPWYELAQQYNKTVQLFGRQLLVVKAIVLLIVLLGITNTMMRNVMERTGEIGTVMALGYRREQVLGLFLAEGVLIGALGAGGGVLLGWLIAEAVSAVGIPMPPPPGLDVSITAEILVGPGLALGTFLLVAGSTIVASLYPSWKASRMQIVDALRQWR